MGLPQKLGLLAQSVQQDTSLNIGIGGAANASFKLQVTGATNLTGALSGTSATFSGDLTIDTNTLFVDSTNNRVGIGTIAPDLTLTVNGAMNLRNSTRAGAFEIDSSGNLWMGTATTLGNLYFETGHSTTGLPSTGTLRMTINGSGNVGIGVTPSAWDTTIFKGLQVANSNAFLVGRVDAASQLQIGTNTYYNADGNWKFIQNGYATRYIQNSGVHSWEYSNASGTAGNNVTFNEAMRISSSGLVELNAADATYIRFSYLGTSKAFVGVAGASSDVISGAAAGDTVIRAQQKMLFSTGGDTERMRITSGGQVTISSSLANNFILSVTNSSSTSGEGIISNLNSSSSTLTFFAGYSTSDSAYKFLARTNGDVRNATGVYGTISSDRRLKENIVSATPKLDDIMKLNVVNFNLIGNQEKQIGFIAQEMQEVFPSLVDQTDTRQYDEDGNVISGLEDAFGVKVGMEFAILVKAIQEQQAQIEELKAKIK